MSHLLSSTEIRRQSKDARYQRTWTACRPLDFNVKSNAITTLSFSGTAPSFSATLQGKASYSIVSVATGQQLYGEGNDTFIATATDGDNGLSQSSGKDTFSLSVFNSSNTSVPRVATTPLGGGNIVAHS